jgi:hypothetical protein
MAIVASEPDLLMDILFPEADSFGVPLIEGAMTGYARCFNHAHNT